MCIQMLENTCKGPFSGRSDCLILVEVDVVFPLDATIPMQMLNVRNGIIQHALPLHWVTITSMPFETTQVAELGGANASRGPC